MARVEVLRALMNERLAAVVEDICGLFETTIAEYEEKLCRSNEETEQQRELLSAVLNKGGKLTSAAGIQQVLVIEEQQECSPHQNVLQPFHIKVEQEGIWSSQEGQYLEGPVKSPSSGAPVKSDSQNGQEHCCTDPSTILNVFPADTRHVVQTKLPSEQQEQRPTVKQEEPRPEEDQETPHSSLDEELNGAGENREAECPASSSVQQMETDRKDCERADSALQSGSEKTSNSSDCETEDSDDDWKRLHRQSNLKVMKNVEVPQSKPPKKSVPNSDLKPAGNSQSASDIQPANEYKTSDSSEPETEDSDDDWKHSRKPQSNLTTVKPKEAPKSSSKFSCQTNKTFFSCSVCGKRFHLEHQLRKHTKTHSEETTFTCSKCGKHFSQKANLSKHMRSHSADKLLNGPACKKCKDRTSLKRRKTKHLEEKSFPCSTCDQIFENA